MIPPGWLVANPNPISSGLGFMGFQAWMFGHHFNEPPAGGMFYASADGDDYGIASGTFNGLCDAGLPVTLTSVPYDCSAFPMGCILELDYAYEDYFMDPDYAYIDVYSGPPGFGVWEETLQVFDEVTLADTNGHLALNFDPIGSLYTFPNSVYFEFGYNDMGNWDYWFDIDNVEVLGITGAGAPTLDMEMFYDMWVDTEYSWDWVYLELLDYSLVGPEGCDDEVNWMIIDAQTGWMPYDYMQPWMPIFPWTIAGTLDVDPGGHICGWVRDHGIDFGILQSLGLITGDEIMLRFRFQSDLYYMGPGYGYGEKRGVRIDNVFIEDLIDVTDITDPNPVFEDFLDPMCDLSNWCLDNIHYGQYWDEITDTEYCTTFPAVPILDALVWETEIADAYVAELTLESDWSFGADEHETYGRIEISADGGNSYYILDKLFGTSGVYTPLGPYDLTPWAGSEIIIRFIVDGLHADMAMWLSLVRGYSVTYPGPTSGFWCIDNLQIVGKQDNTAPNSEAVLKGTMTDAGWFSSVVTVTITATDDNEVKEIHYILDGSEKVVAGDKAEFTVSGNGEHTLEYWAVDVTGNVETPHNTVPPFRIDSGSPPTVAITAPEPGLYLFGNKLLSMSKVFIIGAFTVEATASDAESGVYRVQFMLDGDLIAEDTEAPFSAYVAAKHMGAGTLKVTAEDFSGNTADDTLDITYYKFL
jgi:hypothetical protein